MREDVTLNYWGGERRGRGSLVNFTRERVRERATREKRYKSWVSINLKIR